MSHYQMRHVKFHREETNHTRSFLHGRQVEFLSSYTGKGGNERTMRARRSHFLHNDAAPLLGLCGSCSSSSCGFGLRLWCFHVRRVSGSVLLGVDLTSRQLITLAVGSSVTGSIMRLRCCVNLIQTDRVLGGGAARRWSQNGRYRGRENRIVAYICKGSSASGGEGEAS
jgi:hypothetical protein